MKHRLAFAAKKLLRMGLLLLGVSLVTFLLMCASPLDPLQTNVGQTALGSMSPEQVEKLEAYWGADTPAAERYLGWLGDVLHGDFGTSLLYRQPVIEVIGERMAGSVWLMISAWVISGVLGVTLGVISGAFRGRWADRLIRGYCLLISGTPAFWLAILLLLVFSVWLGWLPVGLAVPVGMTADAVTFLDRVRHAILPVLTLSITGVANIALHTREKMVDVLESDYVLFARARGESGLSIVMRHGLRITPIAGCSDDRPNPRNVTLASCRIAWGNSRIVPARNCGKRWGNICFRTICILETPSFSAVRI